MFIQTVALKEVKCYAFHGFYPEEQRTGNHFLVDVEVQFYPREGDTEDLAHTVNYEFINSVILETMQDTQKLLETVLRSMMNRLLAAYPFLLTITLGIKKLNPPMRGEIGHSFVQLRYQAES